jgi:hypothetical protein
MLYKSVGAEESLPKVDPFLLFEQAKNQEFLQQSDLLYEYAFDTARSLQDKLLRPMNISWTRIAALKQLAAREAPSPQLESASSSAVSRKGSMTENMFDNQQNAHASGNLDIKTGNLGRKTSVRSSVSNGGGSSSNGGTPVKAGSVSSPSAFLFAASEDSPAPAGEPSDSSAAAAAAAANDEDILAAANKMSAASSVLSTQQAQFLLSCVPLTSVMEGLQMVFSTEIHGFDLSSLHAHSTGLQPCVLLVKLLPPYEQVVLGCYIGGALSPPSQESRGDGSSCVFRLDAPHQQSFGWSQGFSSQVGSDIHEAGSVPSSSSTFRQFAISTATYIAIGGSHAHGTNALRLDENMRFLDVGHSDTFGNDSLLVRDAEGESHALQRSHRFEVRQVELWCGAFSIRRAERNMTLDVNHKASILSTDD